MFFCSHFITHVNTACNTCSRNIPDEGVLGSVHPSNEACGDDPSLNCACSRSIAQQEALNSGGVSNGVLIPHGVVILHVPAKLAIMITARNRTT